MKRLLLPLDGSSSAERILAPAIAIAKKFKAEVVLVHLLEKQAPRTIHGEAHLHEAEAAREYLLALAASELFRDVKVSIHVHQESVEDLAQGIVSHAQELSTDLVLLTVHGITGFTGRFHGNIAQHTLFQGDAPVLFSKAEGALEKKTDFKRVLLPLDGDPEHEIVLPLVKDWARAYGAEVHLLRVVGTPMTLKEENRLSSLLSPRAAAEVSEIEAREARDYLERVGATLKAEGIEVKVAVEKGGVVSKIRSYLRGHQIDLLMLGSHANFGTEAFWNECVGAKLMNTLSVPMVIVPARKDGGGVEG